MKAFLFPGQGSQFVGMGADEAREHDAVMDIYREADAVLDFGLSEIMFDGTEDDLRVTSVTQPAVFVHSIARMAMANDPHNPDCVAGHSLGEFSALVAAGALSFQDGLKLVSARANAMQKACDLTEGTMAAIVGMEDRDIETICSEIDQIVVPANYNCPGQLVISGSKAGILQAIKQLKEAGARRAIELAVGGAFHSPLMQPAEDELARAILQVDFKEPRCPIYQNVSGESTHDPELIKAQLIQQLTSPVKWTQTLNQMIADGVSEFAEVGGRGGILAGFVRRIDRNLPTEKL